ncbi:MAG: hypothetical protein FJX59_06955 [Alphaproteobacteria bacterium]|nr:hypothetical protein [Alphaproteobacteria bacterium]
MSINLYLVLVFVHIVLFAYWLGGDLGVYISSKFIANRNLSLDERFRFMALLLACDMGPRTALILFIPVGLEMARIIGVFEVSGMIGGIVWLFCLAWLAVNWWMFFNAQHPMTNKLRDWDLKLRYVLIPVIAAIALYSMSAGGPVTSLWLQVKLLVFAAVISCGVYLRSEIKNWVGGFAMIRQGGAAADQGNTIIEQSLDRSRKVALFLWGGVALAAFLGKVKPF